MSSAPRIDRLDKNILINGNFDFWQRGTLFIGAGTGIQADRWLLTSASGTNSFGRSTDVPTSSTSQYSMSMASPATIGSNPRIIQRVESTFARSHAGKTVTLMCRIKATDATASPITLSINVANASDNFSSDTLVVAPILVAAPVQNVWNNIIYTFTLPTTAVNGFAVTIIRSVATAVATTTIINDVMLVEGTHTAIPATYIRAGRNAANEFQLCQRYFEKSYSRDDAPGTATSIGTWALRATTVPFCTIRFATEKRSISTINYYDFAGTIARIRTSGSNGTVLNGSLEIGTSGFALIHNTSVSEVLFQWTADSEL